MLRRYFFWYLLLFVASCTATTNNERSNNNSLLKEKDKLLFAVSDVPGLEELQRDYEPFRSALEDVLETKIEFFPVDNIVEATTALQLGLVDLVHVGPSEYAIVRARTNAIPIVALTRPNYLSIIAVRRDSGIESLADLKGKIIELGEVGMTANYIGPIKMVIDAGLNPQSDIKIVYSKDYQLKALKNGDLDAWGRGLHRYEVALQQEGVSESDYLILAKGPQLPHDVFIASSKLEPILVDEIRQRMLKNQDRLLQAILSVPMSASLLNSKFKGATLAPANDSDYDMIREVYKAMGEENFIK
ncbi:phosphate/phosphite/phosphonate ABC transporter substrate-binding protein [Dapis sp. BLCC M229]|uniref:phosphate/phosphite/phosphonate ABC transporter substrate-binding protein n=1 Tax=Dapis sp. BLCC M229 TaxID=3400188 RepID=UPI003CE67DA7